MLTCTGFVGQTQTLIPASSSEDKVKVHDDKENYLNQRKLEIETKWARDRDDDLPGSELPDGEVDDDDREGELGALVCGAGDLSGCIDFVYEMEDTNIGEDVKIIKGRLTNVSKRELSLMTGNCPAESGLLKWNTASSKLYVKAPCSAGPASEKRMAIDEVYRFSFYVQVLDDSAALNLGFYIVSGRKKIGLLMGEGR